MRDTYEKIKRKHLVKKPLFYGLISSFTLLGLYFIILTFANSFQHALQEFLTMWYWILLLIIGFGVQVGLNVYARGFIKVQRIVGINRSIVATGGISTTSMITCCAHHLIDVIPLIGLSAVAVFLDKYQLLFLIIGILSNFIGILWMLRIIRKHNLYLDNGFMRLLMKRVLCYALSFSFLIIFIILRLGS